MVFKQLFIFYFKYAVYLQSQVMKIPFHLPQVKGRMGKWGEGRGGGGR